MNERGTSHSEEAGDQADKPPQSQVNRRTLAFKASVIESADRAQQLLEMNQTEISNASLGLYAELALTIADGGDVEIRVRRPGKQRTEDVTPVEFRLLNRVVTRVRRQMREGPQNPPAAPKQ